VAISRIRWLGRHLTLVCTAVTLIATQAPAQSAEQRGLEIAQEAERRDQGWGDQQADLAMELRNRQGETSSREIRSRVLEVQGDGDKSLTIFDHPADVKGTAFLSYTHATDADDQWLYLPALKRVKRISSANKSGPFMGSEFTYEDIASQEIEKYTYKYIRDDSIDGQSMFVLERYPAYKKSGYRRQVVWVDQQHYRTYKVEYYDRKDALLKTLLSTDYQLYLDKYWRAGRMFMENHQTGKSTILTWSNYRFQAGLSERDFDQAALRRAR